MEIELPLPLRGASQNTHAHWRVRQKAAGVMRPLAMAKAQDAMRSAPWPENPRVRLSATFDMGPDKPGIGKLVKRYRPLDVDNAIASLKPYIDGLRDAKVFQTDSHHFVQWGEVVLNRSAKLHQGRSRVLIVVEVVP